MASFKSHVLAYSFEQQNPRWRARVLRHSAIFMPTSHATPGQWLLAILAALCIGLPRAACRAQHGEVLILPSLRSTRIDGDFAPAAILRGYRVSLSVPAARPMGANCACFAYDSRSSRGLLSHTLHSSGSSAR